MRANSPPPRTPIRSISPPSRGRGGQPATVGAAHGEKACTEAQPGHVRKEERLVEDELRTLLVLASDGLSDQGGGAHAQGLRERKHQEHQVAAKADTRDRLLAQPSHEVEVGKEVEGLKDGA